MTKKKKEYRLSDLVDRNADVSNIIIKLPVDFKNIFVEATADEGKSISHVLRRLMLKYLDERGKIYYRPEI